MAPMADVFPSAEFRDELARRGGVAAARCFPWAPCSSGRPLVVEKLAVPAFMGRLVGKAGSTWPLLLGAPFLFWVLVLYAVTGLQIPAEIKEYKDVVPHWLLYAVFFPVSGLVTLAIFPSGLRFWNLLGSSGQRSGSFVANLVPVMVEISTHKRFGERHPASSPTRRHLSPP